MSRLTRTFIAGFLVILPIVLTIVLVVWVANIYMIVQSRLRVDIRAVKAEADVKEQEAAEGGAKKHP